MQLRPALVRVWSSRGVKPHNISSMRTRAQADSTRGLDSYQHESGATSVSYLTSNTSVQAQVKKTDPQGRLTLADALWYAQQKCGVTAVVDIATLTGACLIALGGSIGGMFSPSDAAAAAVKAASQTAGVLLRLSMCCACHVIAARRTCPPVLCGRQYVVDVTV